MTASLRIGCPTCETPVRTVVPPGPGLQTAAEIDEARLQGRGVTCRNCGHELELYFY